MRLARGHESAHLRQHDDQRILAQIGRFTGHVRAGDDRDATCLARRIGQIAVIGDKALPAHAQGRFHDGMASGHDAEGKRAIDARAHPVAQGGDLGQRRRHIH